MVNSNLPSQKWFGHEFQFMDLSYAGGLFSCAVPIPILMFEDFIRFQAGNYNGHPPDNERTRFDSCLKEKSLFCLVDK